VDIKDFLKSYFFISASLKFSNERLKRSTAINSNTYDPVCLDPMTAGGDLEAEIPELSTI
jgi:hypothetical protein